ncbi:MAG: hypothetical protein AAB654_14200, partial [Acidobacteriota bacterium]
MFSTPHDFIQLRVGSRPPFLMVGAGLSWDLVPGPNTLLKQRKLAAEAKLELSPIDVDVHADGALYEWAERAITELEHRGEALPKLKLAHALGLVSDDRWTAQIGLPLRGTMARHRVIARLAREKRWSSIWSFNWDTHIENALERVGFDRDEPRSMQPWITAYRTIVIREDFRHRARTDVVCVFKPHGCVRALLRAQKELDHGDPQVAQDCANRLMGTSKNRSVSDLLAMVAG